MNNTIIRGDLSSIRVANHTYIGENTIIRPCSKFISSGVTYFPVVIGSHVIIEKVRHSHFDDFKISFAGLRRFCRFVLGDSNDHRKQRATYRPLSSLKLIFCFQKHLMMKPEGF